MDYNSKYDFMQSVWWFYPAFTNAGKYRQILERVPNIKFYKNSCYGSRSVPRERTNMSKLIVAFRSCYEKVPKNIHTDNWK
jgi:hypothetical protein